MGLFNFLQRPLTPEKFARLMLKRVRQAKLPGDYRIDSERFAIVRSEKAGGDGVHWFLNNAYQDYLRGDHTQQEETIRNYLRSWASCGYEPPEDFEDAKPDLLPLLRTRSYYEIDLQLASPTLEATAFPHEQINEHLTVSVGYDLPQSVMTVSDDLLEKWGVTLYEALEAAKQNLREQGLKIAQLGPVYVVAHEDAYDATRLILTDLLEQLEVRGDLIAMVPNREQLILTGSDDEEGLTAMVALAEQGLQHERYLTGIPFRLVDGEWQPWKPPAGHPLANNFRRLEIESLARDYDNQKTLLEQRHAAAGEDVFVASFSAAQNNDTQKIHSFCVWSQGIESLLPVTEEIWLVSLGPDGKPAPVARASWARVFEIAGQLMTPQGTYPERYRVCDFPTAEELAKIGLRQLN